MNENMMHFKWMHKSQLNDTLMSISFSIFGVLLIFGLGFVFPTVNPYIVVKWIVIVCAAVFTYSILGYVFRMFKMMKMMKAVKSEWKVMEPKTKKGKKK